MAKKLDQEIVEYKAACDGCGKRFPLVDLVGIVWEGMFCPDCLRRRSKDVTE